MSTRYQIAQKLHAVTEQPANRENERYWDLIDLICKLARVLEVGASELVRGL